MNARIQRIKVRVPSVPKKRPPVRLATTEPAPVKLTGGITAVCLASGPSLTTEDVGVVKSWRDRNLVGLVVVTNTTFRIAPWADALYAMDRKWWNQYAAEVKQNFRGGSFGPTPCAINDLRVRGVREARSRNSGAGAILLARSRGATKIVLLGYDAQHTGGQTHWHGKHPRGLGDARSVGNWPKQFADLAIQLASIEIINCSRETSLKCWPRQTIEAVLS